MVVARRGLHVSISIRVLGTGSVLLAVLTIVLLLTAKESVQSAMYTQILERVQVGENTLWRHLNERGPVNLDTTGELRFGSWVVKGDHSVVYEVKALTGADATIFALSDGVPTRLTTTVLKSGTTERNDNTPLIGPARAAFDLGQSFTGVSLVAGRLYVNRYDPIKDASGKVIGIIYAGYPLAAMFDAINRTTQTLLTTAVVGLLVLLGLLFAVVWPLHGAAKSVVAAAHGLAGGDIDQTIDVQSHDELGAVATAFREMISYQQHMTFVADAIAAGDLTNDVRPASNRDGLALAFRAMIEKLRTLMRPSCATNHQPPRLR